MAKTKSKTKARPKAKTKAKMKAKSKPKAKAKPKTKHKKSVSKSRSKKSTGKSAFMKPMQISRDLSAVIGKGPMPRTEVTKKLWVYIRKHGLQDTKNRRNINADANLKKVFGGKSTVSMFDMTKLVGKHLS